MSQEVPGASYTEISLSSDSVRGVAGAGWLSIVTRDALIGFNPISGESLEKAKQALSLASDKSLEHEPPVPAELADLAAQHLAEGQPNPAVTRLLLVSVDVLGNNLRSLTSSQAKVVPEKDTSFPIGGRDVNQRFPKHRGIN